MKKNKKGFFLSQAKIKLKGISKKVLLLIRKSLYQFLGGTIFLLLALILLASFFRQDKSPAEEEFPAKEVAVYQVGQTPRTKIMAEVKKENVLQIKAQTSGIVAAIYVREGDFAAPNSQLAYLATNYQGGNSASIQRQIAQKQFENTQAAFNDQLALIEKQRELAEKGDQNSDQLREISAQSIEETKGLINLNQEILDYLNENISLYQATGSAVNRDLISSTQQLKSNYLSALNQLKSSLRALEYESDKEKPPAELSELQKETSLKQLALQQKSLELNKEISYLQYQLALVNECNFFPSNLIAGVIQKVHVQKGDSVSPGSLLFTLAGQEKAVKISALVPKNIAQSIDPFQPTFIYLDGQKIELRPEFISSEAVQASLYCLEYLLPPDYSSLVAEKQSLSLEVPVGRQKSGSALPFIPIDAVYQSDSDSFILVLENGQAKSLKVELGEVYGNSVAVLEGLPESAQIILNRNIIAGEKAKAQ